MDQLRRDRYVQDPDRIEGDKVIVSPEREVVEEMLDPSQASI